MSGRDSEKTKQKILKALEKILIEKGYIGVGVNAVAREAGVDKVLIYRYFGSMEGLLSSFREEREKVMVNIRQIFDEAPDDASIQEIAAMIGMSVFNRFREDKVAREVARWELSESNPLTVSFVKDIEEKQLQVIAELDLDISHDEVMAMTIIVSGLIFMVLRQSVQKPILKLDLDDPSIVTSIEKNLKRLIRGYFLSMENGDR